MSVEINIDVSALQKMAELFDSDKMRAAAGKGFKRGIAQMASYIQQNKLSGQVLNQRSGRLSQAVGHPSVDTGGDQFTAIVGGPFYGGVQEFGASILGGKGSPVMIEGVGWRFMREIKARPWLIPSAEEQKDNVGLQMVLAVQKAWSRGKA